MGLTCCKSQEVNQFVTTSDSSSATTEIELEDRISELPDDILASIVSQFSIEEVVRLSVVSRRWKYLSKFASRLDFQNDMKNRKRIWMEESDDLNFVKRVNQVLESHEISKLEKFRISYSLDKYFKHDLDKWLKIVFYKQVESLDLNLYQYERVKDQLDMYTLTRELFNPSELDPKLIAFKSLKSINLSSVNVSDEVAEFLLNNCPILERLSIRHSPSLVSFKITGAHYALRFLELSGVDFKSVEISDTNLVSFSCNGCFREPNIIINNVPTLANLHLSNYVSLSLLRSGLNHLIPQLSHSLKSLTLSISYWIGYPYLGTLPKLDALQDLLLQVNNSGGFAFSYAPLITMCPRLKKFEFQRGWQTKMPAIKEKIFRSRFAQPHHCLKEVKLAGYYGCIYDLESALYFFDHCPALEKVIINPRDQKNVLFDQPVEDFETKRERAARARARKQLKREAPPRVQLVIL